MATMCSNGTVTRRTMLYQRHVELGGRLVDFHGWELPVQYEGILAEHAHCRESACLFDTCHMGLFLLQGDAVAPAVSQVGTQSAQTMPVGRCRYGFLLNEDGGIIDDTILMRLDEHEFLLVVNAATATGDLEWIKASLPKDVQVKDLSASGWGKIDLQGPLSFQVLSPLVEADLKTMTYFSVARTRCEGRPCIISRTGYTGELGYEVVAAAEDLVAIFERLLEDERVKPAGLGARDSLRLEMCYPLYGHELTTDRNPIEAGLGSFVPDDHTFIGDKALAEAGKVGPSSRLVALKSTSRRRLNAGDEILGEGEVVGRVTSGAFLPSLGVSGGMGYVETRLAEIGTALIVQTGRAELPVTVSEKPLYKNGTCRRGTEA